MSKKPVLVVRLGKGNCSTPHSAAEALFKSKSVPKPPPHGGERPLQGKKLCLPGKKGS